MRTQRKTHHILANNGLSGRDFGYILEVSDKHNFNWDEEIFITDKMDGTTAQADSLGTYQRRDLFKKGDPRKFTATEEERYTVAKLYLAESSNKHIARAVAKYLPIFSKIPLNHMVYFEVFGNKIQARYKGLTPDIRVFGLSIDDEFQTFDEVKMFCGLAGLPVVGHYSTKLSGVSEIVSIVESATHCEEILKPYELEGIVLHQGDQIAKIRKSDLKILQYSAPGMEGGTY